MGLFAKTPPGITPEAFRALQGRVEGLETALKTIRLEWEDVLDRLGRVMGRLNARLRSPRNDDLDPGKGESTPPVWNHLEAQRKLRERRRHGVLRHG